MVIWGWGHGREGGREDRREPRVHSTEAYVPYVRGAPAGAGLLFEGGDPWGIGKTQSPDSEAHTPPRRLGSLSHLGGRQERVGLVGNERSENRTILLDAEEGKQAQGLKMVMEARRTWKVGPKSPNLGSPTQLSPRCLAPAGLNFPAPERGCQAGFSQVLHDPT